MKENVSSFLCATNEQISTDSESSKVRGKIVDFPGYPSLRKWVWMHSFICSQLEKYYPHTAGIVFMIDGTDYNVKDIAEYMIRE